MKTMCNIQRLLSEIRSLSFTMDGSGAEMVFPPSKGLPSILLTCPEMLKAVHEISRFRGQAPLNLMINRLKAEVMVPVHRDWIKPTQYQKEKPTVERWHLPVKTNEHAKFWDSSMEDLQGVHFELGVWSGPIPYWLNHTVYNTGTRERIHIVVDLDTPYPIGSYEEDVDSIRSGG